MQGVVGHTLCPSRDGWRLDYLDDFASHQFEVRDRASYRIEIYTQTLHAKL
jgi:hypothetical protein